MTSGWAEQTEVMPAGSPRAWRAGRSARSAGHRPATARKASSSARGGGAFHRALAADGEGAGGVGEAERLGRGEPAQPAGDEGARRRCRRRRWGRPPRPAKAGAASVRRRRRGRLAPSAPFLTTTARMPRARSSRAAAASSVAAGEEEELGAARQEQVGEGEHALHASRGCRGWRGPPCAGSGRRRRCRRGRGRGRRRRARGRRWPGVESEEPMTCRWSAAVDQAPVGFGVGPMAPAALWRML